MNDDFVEREMRLQRYLDRELSAEESARFEETILASDELSEALIDELSLRELIETRRRPGTRTPRTRAPRQRRWAFPAVAAAAAAAIILVVWPRDETTRGPVFRSGDSSGTIALEPLGDLQAAPLQFRWHSVPGAQSYRLEVFDERALRVLRQSVGDTIFVLPDGGQVPSSGFWQITPIDDLGMPGARSEPFRFTVTN